MPPRMGGMTLSAPWLGSWKAPWAQTRGRRWGDSAWALQALAQAWMLGGRVGQWPRVTWKARRPQGPFLSEEPLAFAPRPDPAWIALLRHGSPLIPAERRGAKEDELRAWCWEALLKGDGSPWMAAGTVLLDKATRLRWIPLLGAIDEGGTLILPPFLAPLVPDALCALPPNWWATLLGSLDAEGRLLPSGDLPIDLPWEDLRPHLEPLLLKDLPPSLEPHRGAPWLAAIPGQGWMIDPHLRAWGRGWGAAPTALASLKPAALALGDPAIGPLALFLTSRPPRAGLPSEAWEAALAFDLEPLGERPPCPPLSGDPSLDRLRVRWGGALPEAQDGYPVGGESVHPCADPFHWMAEGHRAYHAQELEPALQAFAWAHAHFTRLGASEWARRAASNAAAASLFWADLRAMEAWQSLRGPQPSPFKELEALAIRAGRGEWNPLEPDLRRILKTHPDNEQAWNMLAEGGLTLHRHDWIQEALPHLTHADVRTQMEACLLGWPTPAPAHLQPEQRLTWALHRALKGQDSPECYWEAWAACPNHLIRLETGLDLLEGLPSERKVEYLLALQAIESRAKVHSFRTRLRKLWPEPGIGPAWEPRALIEAMLARLSTPLWLVWGSPEGAPHTAGTGAVPPEGLLVRLHEDGALAPMEAGAHVWWGFPLHWQGTSVGWALVGLEPGSALEAPLEVGLMAPWIAQLAPALPPAPMPEAGELLADGSEPMATVLRELDRVAPSSLPVLILGPTGSGKELAARELHRRSQRPGKLVPINVTAFSESLLESELFGHVKGAFTGADRDRQGAIESASGGTLFLDEVADLSLRLQSLLLRVLQEREVRKVGSDKATRVDVRFVAATHRSLEDLVEAGAFRRDLLFRLQGTVLRLPSLAERRHEFPFLIPRLVSQVARDARRDAPPLAPGLPQALRKLPWTGNFRELRHALERAMLRCGEGALSPSHFPELEAPPFEERSWEEATRAFQRKLLLDTLRQHGFKAAEAASALGLARPALYTTAKRLGVDLVAAREPKALA